MEARFSAPVKTGPGVHQAFSIIDNVFPSGKVKRPGRGLTNYPHPEQGLCEELNRKSSHPLGFHGLFWGESFFFFLLLIPSTTGFSKMCLNFSSFDKTILRFSFPSIKLQ